MHNFYRKRIHCFSKKTILRVWSHIQSSILDLGDLGIELYDLFEFHVGSGNGTLFWLDNWLGSGSLASRFPLLYGLDSRKSCFISDRLASWSWRQMPRSPVELAELEDLSEIIRHISISGSDDCWKFKLSGDDRFVVCAVRRFLDLRLTIPVVNPTVWINLVPLKVSCFVWRACMGRIPSASALSRRGIRIENSSCSFCHLGIDDADHSLVCCPFVDDVLA